MRGLGWASHLWELVLADLGGNMRCKVYLLDEERDVSAGTSRDAYHAVGHTGNSESPVQRSPYI